jgi:hypothetical protein
MVSSSQIRAGLSLFLDGVISLDEFEDWFVQNTWNIHLSGSVDAESLTFAVEESLAEFSSHHIDEPKLRGELARVLHAGTKVVDIIDTPQAVIRFRSSSPVRFVRSAV